VSLMLLKARHIRLEPLGFVRRFNDRTSMGSVNTALLLGDQSVIGRYPPVRVSDPTKRVT
jgi:hypothetical protein